MNKEELKDLCMPKLSTIWPDIHQLLHSAGVCGKSAILKDKKHIDEVWAKPENWYLNLLKSPIGSDILVRRTATAVSLDVKSSANWSRNGRMEWKIWTNIEGQRVGGLMAERRFSPTKPPKHVSQGNYAYLFQTIPALAGLDSSYQERINWNLLGSIRLVDLAALVLTAQHLYTMEKL